MIYPQLWLKHARVRRAMLNYPLYDVPYKRAERMLNEAEVQENFGYFLRVRVERLEFLQKWLVSNFSVNASLDGNGLTAVSRWIDEYGGGLVPDEPFYAFVFATYQPLWAGTYAGYNVMFDLGIFLGEYLIAKRPRLSWDIYRGHAVEPATYESAGYLRPHLAGMPRGWGCDVLGSACNIAANSRENSKIGRDRRYVEKDLLIRAAQSSLCHSRLPDGGNLIVSQEARNEPN